MTFKIRYLLLAMFLPIILPIVICLFWPKLIIVHYDNPNEPLIVSLTQYDEAMTEKTLKSGTHIFRLRQGFSRWESDLAFVHWVCLSDNQLFSINGKLKAPSAEDSLDLNICRGSIYINKDGSVQKVEWTYPVFMNFCL